MLFYDGFLQGMIPFITDMRHFKEELLETSIAEGIRLQLNNLTTDTSFINVRLDVENLLCNGEKFRDDDLLAPGSTIEMDLIVIGDRCDFIGVFTSGCIDPKTNEFSDDLLNAMTPDELNAVKIFEEVAGKRESVHHVSFTLPEDGKVYITCTPTLVM